MRTAADLSRFTGVFVALTGGRVSTVPILASTRAKRGFLSIQIPPNLASRLKKEFF